MAHGVGVPSNHSTTEFRYVKGRDSGQSDHVVLKSSVAGVKSWLKYLALFESNAENVGE